MKKTTSGFTLIELTIVIMAISAASAILVITFKINIQISRDTVRKSNVNIVANTIKLNRIGQTDTEIKNSKSNIISILQSNLVSLPKAESENHYYYGYSAKKDDFFVIVCGENDEEFFVAGTNKGIIAANSVYAGNSCQKNLVPVKNRNYPMNKKAPNTRLDAYLIYQLS